MLAFTFHECFLYYNGNIDSLLHVDTKSIKNMKISLYQGKFNIILFHEFSILFLYDIEVLIKNYTL